jgi:carbon monoxide dehydrogenase subunit G
VPTKTFDVSTVIDNTPEAVIAYVADVRNRPLFFKSVSISDVNGQPDAVGTTWKWTFSVLGMEFQGTGRCLQHEPGRLYAFQTEGGLESKFTYRVAPEGNGTRLTVTVEYSVPENVLARLPAETVGLAMRQTEAERVLQNLKTILDR